MFITSDALTRIVRRLPNKPVMIRVAGFPREIPLVITDIQNDDDALRLTLDIEIDAYPLPENGDGKVFTGEGIRVPSPS
jgi:hypothetical protein